jgi:hypothetical protein
MKISTILIIVLTFISTAYLLVESERLKKENVELSNQLINCNLEKLNYRKQIDDLKECEIFLQ